MHSIFRVERLPVRKRGLDVLQPAARLGKLLQPSPVQISRLAGGRYSILRSRSFITVPMAPADRLATSPIDWGGCNGSC